MFIPRLDEKSSFSFFFKFENYGPCRNTTSIYMWIFCAKNGCSLKLTLLKMNISCAAVFRDCIQVQQMLMEAPELGSFCSLPHCLFGL